MIDLSDDTHTTNHEPTRIFSDFHVWSREFQRVAACVMCDNAAILPDSIDNIDDAKAYLTRNPPTCHTHTTHRLTTRAKLRSRRWFETTDETFKLIDLFHLTTVVLRNFKPLRKTEGANAWLKGERTRIPEPLLDTIHEWIDRSSNRDHIADLNARHPVVTRTRAETIAASEVSSDMIDAQIHEHFGDDDFNSVIDLVLLSR